MKKVIVLALVILGMVFFAQSNTYVLHSYIEETGYAMPKVKLTKTLMDQATTQADPISLVRVSEEEAIYQNGNSYYAGEDKQEVDLEIPILIKEATGMRLTGTNASLITSEFEALPTYDGMYVSGGNSFQADGQQADLDQMILLQTKSGLYMNTTPITIKTILKTYEFPINSILNFEEIYINSFSYETGTYNFVAVRGLQNAKITIGDVEMSYKDFLKKLNIVKDEIKQQEEENKKIEEEIKNNEKNEEAPSTGTTTKNPQDDKNNNPSNKPGNISGTPDESDKETPGEDGGNSDEKNPSNPGEAQKPEDGNTPTNPSQPGDNDNPGTGGEEGEETPGGGDGDGGEDVEDPGTPPIVGYIKPTISCDELKPWVYTVHTNLKVEDPAARLIRNVRFNIYDEKGKLILRKQYRSTATAVLSTLPPNSTLYVQGSFQYYDASGRKTDEVFLPITKVVTKPIDGNVKSVKVAYQQHEILSNNKMVLDQMVLSNDSDYQANDPSLENFYKNTLPYVSKIIMTFTDNKTGEVMTSSVNNDTMKKLIAGQTLEVASGSVLKSNSSYTYEINLQDRFGNELPTVPELMSGSIRTAKKTPTLKPKILVNKAGSFQVSLTISDENQAIQEGRYKVSILDETGEKIPLYYTSNTGSGEGETDIVILTDQETTTLNITNLPFAQRLTLVASADYDLNDNAGVTHKEINKTSFFSASIESGTVSFTNSFSDILGTSATLHMQLNQKSNTSLVELLTDFDVVLDGGGQKITVPFNKESINAIDIEKNYDNASQSLIIQEEDKARKLPKITMGVPKTVLTDNKMTPWQVLINGAFYKDDSTLIGKLHIFFGEDTLMPSTVYTLSMNCQANQAGYSYVLKYTLTKDTFTTKKQEPRIIYDDMFLSQNFIEFYNLCVKDPDGTIVSDAYTVELLKNDEVIDSYKAKPNEVIEKLRFENLGSNQQYMLRFIVAKYNDGHTVGTMQYEYVINEMGFHTKDGLKAAIDLEHTQFNYNNSDITTGNLDLSKIQYNTGIDYNSSAKDIEKPGYFLTEKIAIDTTKWTILQNFGTGTLYLRTFNANNQYLGLISYDSYLKCFNTRTASSYANYAYFQIEGMMGNENEASIFSVEERENDLQDINILNNTNLSLKKEVYNPATCTSEYINVTPGDYFLSNAGQFYFFDQNKNYIGKFSKQLGLVPQNAVYMRLVYNVSEITDFNAYYYYRFTDVERTEGITAKLHETIYDEQGILSETDTYQITQYSTKNMVDLTYQKDDELSFPLQFQNDLAHIDEYRAYNLKEDKAYRFELSVTYHGRQISLDTVDFKTTGRTHVLKNEYDLLNIGFDPSADYIAVNDINETTTGYIAVTYFFGSIDFQGHTLNLMESRTSNRIYELAQGAVLKNIRVTGGTALNYYFISYNSGCIDNLVYAPTATDNSKKSALIHSVNDRGVVSNFIVEFNGDYRAEYRKDSHSGILININSGRISNGYVYNKVKNAHIYIGGNGGIVCSSNEVAGIIENVYAVTDLYSNFYTDGYDKLKPGTGAGVIAGRNVGRNIKNTMVIGDRFQYTLDGERPLDGGYDLSFDPSLGYSNSNKVSTNSYAFTENTKYTTWFSAYDEKKTLWNTNRYDGLNSADAFVVDDLVTLGYYPRLKLNSCMQNNQPYLQLPEIKVATAPKLMGSEVLKQTEDYAEVVLRFKNPDIAAITDISAENIDCIIYEQQMVNDFYEVTVRLTLPKKYFSSYHVTSFKYRSGAMEYTSMTTIPIEAEFYKPIKSFEDWAQMNNSSTTSTELQENFRLKTDLDFSMVSDYDRTYITGFTGKLDGGIYDKDGNLIGMHKLLNITPPENYAKNSALFNVLRGSMSNIIVDGFTWSHNKNSSGLIYSLYGTVDNVHIRNVDISSVNFVGSLTCLQYPQSVIKNCSVKNATFKVNKNIPANTYSFVRLGTLIGYSDAGTITNCYTSDFQIDIDGISSTAEPSIGGILGLTANAASIIQNSYAIGHIAGATYNGGILGKGDGKIEQCYANVIIQSNSEFNGGIRSETTTKTKNCLSLGNLIISKADNANAHRISGSNSVTLLNNYAFSNQTINNINVGVDDTDGLLNKEELSDPNVYKNKIQLGDEFSYTNVSTGTLPKLKNTNGSLLPDQQDAAIPSDTLSMKVISANLSSETYTVDFEIQHKGYSVKSINIDGMSITNTQKSDGSDGVTAYHITSNKLKAFDLYKIEVILEDLNNKTTTVTLETTINYGEPVYWEVQNIEQWNALMQNHATTNENFKITGIIDFSKDTNPTLDLIVNRIVGINPTESGFANLSFHVTQGNNLINTCIAEITGLSFENFSMDYVNVAGKPTLNPSNIGIIGKNLGNISNCTFDNNTIDYEKNSTVGMIGNNNGNMENIQLSNITIKKKTVNAIAGNNIGALAGISTGHYKDISARDIVVEATESNSVGGVVGYNTNSYINAKSTMNVNVENMKVSGNSNVGGITGDQNGVPCFNFTGNNIKVEGKKNNIGGAFGRFNGQLNNLDIEGVSFKDIDVHGDTYVGGILGSWGSAVNIKVSDIVVKGDRYYVGGIAGQGNGGGIEGTEIRNSKIIGVDGIGGIAGYQSGSSTNNMVVNCEITGERYVGGIMGTPYLLYTNDIFGIEITPLNTYYTMVGVYDSKITASQDYAGGIVSIFDSTYTGYGATGAVMNSEISARSYAGGVYGKLYGANNTTTTGTMVRGSTIKVNNSYAGGIAGQAELQDNIILNNAYVANLKISGDAYVGGIYGHIQKKDGVKVDAKIGKFLIYDISLAAADEKTVDIIAPNAVDVLTIDDFNGLKIEESSTVNGDKVQQVLHWSDDTKTHIEIITKEDITDWAFLFNATNHATKPGLNWSTNGFYLYQTLALNRDNSAPTGKHNDFTFTPIDYQNRTFLIHADVADGTYPVTVSVGSKTGTVEATFVDKEAEVTFKSSELNIATQYITMKIKVESETLSAVFRYGMNYLNTAKVESGKIYYEGNDVGEQVVTLEEGTYTWYRSNLYGYTTDRAESVRGVTGNSIKLTSRGYYFAVNAADGKISPLITFDTYGFLPNVRYNSSYDLCYQEGLAQSGNYDSAYSTKDGYYQGDMNYKLDYIPRESSISLSNSSSLKNQALPKVQVYASGINSINVELDETPVKELSVSVQQDDATKEYTMSNRVMTVSYDFVEDMKITISNGSEEHEYSVTAKDVAQSVSTYENDYYYLIDDGVKTSNKTVEGDFVHLYHDQALTSDQIVVDLSNDEKISAIENGEQLETATLYSGTYGDYQLDAFKNYTLSSQGVSSKELNQQLLQKRGMVFGIDGAMEREGNSIIVDTYNEKQFETVLTTQGKLVNIKDEIKVPDGFRNENIVEISDNNNTDKSIMLVRYEDGTLVGFDYLNGEALNVESKTEDIGFYSFMKSSFLSLFDAPMQNLQETDQEVANFEDSLESLELQDLSVLQEAAIQLQIESLEKQVQDSAQADQNELAEMKSELEEQLVKVQETAQLQQQANQKEKQPYITIYDVASKSYQTYRSEDLLKEKQVISENRKIEKVKEDGKELSISTSKQPKAVAMKSETSWVAIVTISIFAVIGSLLILLKRKRKFLN